MTHPLLPGLIEAQKIADRQAGNYKDFGTSERRAAGRVSAEIRALIESLTPKEPPRD